ncbi:MAG: hypothetical protein MRY72_04105, partial [Aquisalinus sp.]|nr:hypothetical protein [Aquisalinus sp.]
MRLDLLNDVRAELGRKRHTLYYYRDRYATMLLRWVFGEHITISDVRQSPFRGLLEKPSLKAALSDSGNGILDLETVEASQM